MGGGGDRRRCCSGSRTSTRPSPQYLIPLGFLGFVLCIVRWKTGSLYPCMALHSINNCVALGVNEFHWNAGEIVALTVGALAADRARDRAAFTRCGSRLQ